jgi:uncharacterized protein YdeI (YjbR/CyaY-like superfamily)
MTARYFRTAAEFRRWLAAHHATETELLVGFYKKASGIAGITYQEAVDEALCYGWIDGVLRPLDADSFAQRFTPRTAKSIWSRVNIAKVEGLIKAGRMAAPGLKCYRERDPKRANLYSFERPAMTFSPALARLFRKSAAAWRFFQAQPPGYCRLLTFWVKSPKQEKTRETRLARLIEASSKGKRLR